MTMLKLLHDLEHAARMEDWDRVDKELIPQIKAEKSFYAVQRAVYKLQDENAHVRDAFATVIQNGYDFSRSRQEWREIKDQIASHMVEKNESNPAVRHRIAIAFAYNDICGYRDLVISRLKEAVNDKYVGEDAKKALDRIHGWG